MSRLAEEALRAISKDVLQIFQNEYLEKEVYGSHGENKQYIRTNQFFEAWEFSEIKKQLNSLSTELWYNPSNMSFNPDTYTHGSKYSSPPDVRDNLMRILDKAGYSSSLWLSVSRPVAYWQSFIQDMFSGGQLEKIVTKHFRAKGFTRI